MNQINCLRYYNECINIAISCIEKCIRNYVLNASEINVNHVKTNMKKMTFEVSNIKQYYYTENEDSGIHVMNICIDIPTDILVDILPDRELAETTIMIHIKRQLAKHFTNITNDFSKQIFCDFIFLDSIEKTKQAMLKIAEKYFDDSEYIIINNIDDRFTVRDSPGNFYVFLTDEEMNDIINGKTDVFERMLDEECSE